MYSQFLSFLVLEFLLAIFRVNLPTGAGNCRKHSCGYEVTVSCFVSSIHNKAVLRCKLSLFGDSGSLTS